MAGEVLSSLGQSLSPNNVINSLRAFQDISSQAQRDQLLGVQIEAAKTGAEIDRIRLSQQQQKQKIADERQEKAKVFLDQIKAHPHSKELLKDVIPSDPSTIFQAYSELENYEDTKRSWNVYKGWLGSRGKKLPNGVEPLMQGKLDNFREYQDVNDFLDVGMPDQAFTPEFAETEQALAGAEEGQAEFRKIFREKGFSAAMDFYEGLPPKVQASFDTTLQNKMDTALFEAGNPTASVEKWENGHQARGIVFEQSFNEGMTLGVEGFTMMDQALSDQRALLEKLRSSPFTTPDFLQKETKRYSDMLAKKRPHIEKEKKKHQDVQANEAVLIRATEGGVDLSDSSSPVIQNKLRAFDSSLDDQEIKDAATYYLQNEADLAPKLTAAKNSKNFNARSKSKLENEMGVEGQFSGSSILNTLGIPDTEPMMETFKKIFPGFALDAIAFEDPVFGGVVGFPQNGGDYVIGLYRDEVTGDYEFSKYPTKYVGLEEGQQGRQIDFEAASSMSDAEAMSTFDTSELAQKEPLDFTSEEVERIVSAAEGKLYSSRKVRERGLSGQVSTRTDVEDLLGIGKKEARKLWATGELLRDRARKLKSNVGFFEIWNESPEEAELKTADLLQEDAIRFLKQAAFSAYFDRTTPLKPKATTRLGKFIEKYGSK